MNEKSKNKFNCHLYFSAMTANALYITTGSSMVWTSPVLPQLSSNDTSINPLEGPISVLQASLLMSLNPIGIVVGSVFLGKVPDTIGRKKTLIIVAAGVSVFNTALYFVKYLYQFITLILLAAINQSLLMVVVPTYTSEVAGNHNRGSLGCQLSLLVIIGQLIGLGVGGITKVSLFFLSCAIPSSIVLILTIFISESPIYFILKGDKSRAVTVLNKLGKTTELCEMEMEMESIEKQNLLQTSTSQTQINWKSIFFNRPVRKGFILVLGMVCFIDLSGSFVILTSMNTILTDIGASLSVNVIIVAIMTIQLFFAILAVVVIEKIGRRPLILTGFFICGCAMFVLGLFFYFHYNKYELSQSVRLIPLIAMVCHVSANTMGISSTISVLRTELLPNELRSVGSSITMFLGTIVVGVVLFIQPFVASYLGLHYSMFIFSFSCYSGFVFFYVLLPETKGKSFDEIRGMLAK